MRGLRMVSEASTTRRDEVPVERDRVAPEPNGSAVPRDEAAVSGFVERFAGILTDAGMPRIASRVFVALLATDSGRLTAAELADRLQASPAAISGAVRYLIPLGLVSREREPGSRRDHYRVYDDIWYELMLNEDKTLGRMRNGLREGVDALGGDTPAGARVAESVEFIEFLQNEMRLMKQRWYEHRAGARRQPGAPD
ncbi:GbsR/MarR family transcriptional regulator [Planosporangium sp. 12N6]|uniref:GbsR/MarR family transcriptional regulator n=1 Tax=Planosporangium spinosum TaxID=3402278 RepID=UPI003CF14DB7